MYNTLQIKSNHLLNSGSHEAELATSKLHSYTKYKTLDKEMKRNEKSTRRRCKHCTLAVVRRSQKILPAADPFLGTWDGQNLISRRWSLPLPIDPVWGGSMNAISSYHGNRPTNTGTDRTCMYVCMYVCMHTLI